ncbi:hypothetical protein K420107F6_29570 [Lactonifactor longoviformis]
MNAKSEIFSEQTDEKEIVWGWPLEGGLCSEDDSAGVIRESKTKPESPQEIFSAVQAEKK